MQGGVMSKLLSGKKGLVVGVANDKSIAWGCARAFSEAGAELAVTFQTPKAEQFVRPLAEQAGASIIRQMDVQDDAQMQGVFAAIGQQWGKLDFVLHSIAFAPREDLHGRVTDSSRDGFLSAMDISCHSFIRMARVAEPLMKEGGTLLTTSYYGSEKVVEHYGIMGPVKAALEASVKYLAAELGPLGIRVNALSPGPLLTRAASGIAQFDKLLEDARERSPQRDIVTIEAVGALARFLVSDDARYITGNVEYIDAGYHIIGG